jgi:general secretion pathway protein H
MVVVALIAIAAGIATLTLRDGGQSRLDEEAVRLTALLESARADARASGLSVRWEPTGPDESGTADFRFIGLPPSAAMPVRWLKPGVNAQIVGARAVVLGPEPLIGAQRIVLSLADRQVELVTDGLGPFTVVDGVRQP